MPSGFEDSQGKFQHATSVKTPVQVNMHEAKTQLSKLIEMALKGEEVIIARNGTPVVQLVPVGKAKLPPRKPGAWKGKVWIAPDFDDTPEEVIDSFYDSMLFPGEEPDAES